jgi:hypothetical protein
MGFISQDRDKIWSLANMITKKFRVFWDAVSYNHVEVHRRFRVDGISTHL